MAIVCENCGHRHGGTGASIDSIPELRGHDASAVQRALAQPGVEIVQFKYAEGHISAKRRAILDRLNGVVYPVLTLPPEITSHIFVHCLPHHGRVRPSPRSAPLVLTQICGQWRAIALSTGELWSSLDVNIDVLCPGRDDLLRSWFPRAKVYPLSLTIRQPRRLQTYSGPLSHVADIIPKLRRLEVKVCDGQFRSLVPLGTPLPLLRFFAATVSSENLQSVLRSAPNLCELRTRLYEPNFHVASKSLLSLEIWATYSIDVFLDILENCPLLSHLKIDVRIEDDHKPSLARTFPHLRSLAFSRAYCERALDFVTLPNLTRLEGVELDRMRPDIVQPFLSRSSCVIEYLACSSHPAPEYMEPALGMFPWLETLELTIPAKVQTLSPVLLWLDPDTMSLAPQLRHITIQFDAIEYIDFPRVVDVLKRRRELQLLRVIGLEPAKADPDPWCRPGRTAAAELEGLRSLGVNFSMRIWKFGDYDGSPSDEVWPNSEKCAKVNVARGVALDFLAFTKQFTE
ncbi:hypothetical protein GGX14DRAFT_596446 [Mycena pura]|uniref:F-box domain-containing protein n=1 Tax=Mycena pura TaxID=153505 RepID=A0AAD6XZG7_9AGAR|nr:hypothetical protein GGX14DRAFT_596446 [Mycena pura]